MVFLVATFFCFRASFFLLSVVRPSECLAKIDWLCCFFLRTAASLVPVLFQASEREMAEAAPDLPTPKSMNSNASDGSNSDSDSDSDSDDSMESGESDFGGYSSGVGSDDDLDGNDSGPGGDSDNEGDLGGGGASPMHSIVPGNASKSSTAARVSFTNDVGVRTRMADMITETCDILAMDKAHVEMFLHYYKWNCRTLQEQWFDSPDKVRKTCGFLTDRTAPPPLPNKPAFECYSCGNEECQRDDMHALDCGHYFCKDCWAGYLSVQVENGPGCVYTKCMEPECEQSVLRSTWTTIDARAPSQGLLKTFDKYMARSYCNENAHISWCPAAGCEVIVEYKGGGAQDIVCRCGHKFCFRCKEEAHRPASCADVRKWHLKNTSESENVNWMLANTKDCSKCGRPIEKNQGCNHMTCDKRSGGCGHEFCWLCMGDWSSHGSATGGFYKCNKYEEMKSQGKLNEVENRRKTAESEINKYMHYLERFMNHKKSMGFAENTLLKIESAMERLQTENDYKITEVQFLKVRHCHLVCVCFHANGPCSKRRDLQDVHDAV